MGDCEALEEIPSRNMHFEGFGRKIIQRMQIFEENTGRVGGVDLFEDIVHVEDCKTL